MCIDDQMLSAYMDGELMEPYLTQVKEHLEHCQACRTRLEELTALMDKVKDAAIPEETLLRNKDRIYSLLDDKFFTGKKKVNFFRRRIEMGMPSLITAAAAVIFIFVGGFMFFGSSEGQTTEILPSFQVNADSQNVQFVSDTPTSLDDYTLEEILEYLDQKGYDVDISIKGLKPID